MNAQTLSTLSFNNTKLDIVDRNGQQWMPSVQLATALGYKRLDAVAKIYDRNSNEFTPNMTALIDNPKLGVSGNLKQTTRIFSLRGAHLVAMFSRTEKAKAFRAWVLDIIESQQVTTALPSPTISPADQRAIQERVAQLAAENKAYPKYYSALKTHFRVAKYDQIPTGKLEEALAVLNGVVVQPIAAIPNQPTTLRTMISNDYRGRQIITPIPDDAYVMTIPDLLKALNEPNGAMVSTETLAEFITVSTKRLQSQCEHYEKKHIAA